MKNMLFFLLLIASISMYAMDATKQSISCRIKSSEDKKQHYFYVLEKKDGKDGSKLVTERSIGYLFYCGAKVYISTGDDEHKKLIDGMIKKKLSHLYSL